MKIKNNYDNLFKANNIKSINKDNNLFSNKNIFMDLNTNKLYSSEEGQKFLYDKIFK